ncbi:MAG: hypothetical protein VX278_08760, partial [Myxococcota bacterium]|nr:hypothetical protein [Myxococcota bacterium]
MKEIEKMTSICAYEKCPILAEPNHEFCVLHQKRDGKNREEIIDALEKYEQCGQKQIVGAYLRGADFSRVSISQKNFQYSDLRN